MKFRRRSADVDAIVWDGTNSSQVEDFVTAHKPSPGPVVMPRSLVRFNPPTNRTSDEPTMALWIEKSRAWAHQLSIGTAVIAEPDDLGVYPCEPAIFAATYEAVTG